MFGIAWRPIFIGLHRQSPWFWNSKEPLELDAQGILVVSAISNPLAPPWFCRGFGRVWSFSSNHRHHRGFPASVARARTSLASRGAKPGPHSSVAWGKQPTSSGRASGTRKDIISKAPGDCQLKPRDMCLFSPYKPHEDPLTLVLSPYVPALEHPPCGDGQRYIFCWRHFPRSRRNGSSNHEKLHFSRK